MKRGDIYMVDLEPTAGHEQRGHRPVLVVSADAFNRLTQCPIMDEVLATAATIFE